MANPVHALVVHFPVALLLVAPLFLCAGALMRPDRARVFALATLLLMILGTTGGWIAVATGKSAAEASAQGGAAGMIQHHEQLAETTSAVFTLLTPSYAAIVLLSFRQPQQDGWSRACCRWRSSSSISVARFFWRRPRTKADVCTNWESRLPQSCTSNYRSTVWAWIP
jgi:predicted membrane protein DUF2231